jgi:hypothetical protein
VLFTQTLEIKNRQGLWAVKGMAEEIDDFLRHGAMLALRPNLELPIESVGKVLDVEDCH